MLIYYTCQPLTENDEIAIFFYYKMSICFLYFSMDYINWVLMPTVSSEVYADAKQVKGRFTGDPSHEFKIIDLTDKEEEKFVSRNNCYFKLLIGSHFLYKMVKNKFSLVQKVNIWMKIKDNKISI